MKHQVLLLMMEHGKLSTILPAMVVNCTDERTLMTTLEAAAIFGHEAEVKTLDDDEPWPSLEERLGAA